MTRKAPAPVDDEPVKPPPVRSATQARRLTVVRHADERATSVAALGADPLAARLADLSAQIADLHRDEVASVLTAVVAMVRGTVRGIDGAGVVALHRSGAVTATAPSGDAVRQLDVHQAALAEGPGVDALALLATPDPTSQAPSAVEAVDLADAWGAGGRWPRFAVEARRHGVRGALSLPISTPTTGWPRYALTLYRGDVGAVTGDERVLACAVSAHATLALAAAGERTRLLEALRTRDVIGQAKGILMQRHALDADAAFARLVQASQHANLKLRDVAAWLVDDASRGSSG